MALDALGAVHYTGYEASAERAHWSRARVDSYDLKECPKAGSGFFSVIASFCWAYMVIASDASPDNGVSAAEMSSIERIPTGHP
jgi:hypothetical protein